MAVQNRRVKLVRWWLFSVLVGLVPLVISYMGSLLDSDPLPLFRITSRGELMLISTAIASAAVGELIPGGGGKALQKLLAGGGCVLLVLLASLFFAAVQSRQDPDAERVFVMSMWIFAGTLATSFTAVFLAWEGEP